MKDAACVSYITESKRYGRVPNGFWRELGPEFHRSSVLYKNPDEDTEPWERNVRKHPS